MWELDECLLQTKRIKEIEEQILELQARATSPKNQVITGMPRGGNVTNPADNYIMRLERLTERRDKLKRKRDRLWHKIESSLINKHIKEENITLLYYRFYQGKQWNKCRDMLCKEYPNSKWNMNKVFRIYRQVIRKFEVDKKA